MLLNADFLRLKMRSQKVVLTNGGSLIIYDKSIKDELAGTLWRIEFRLPVNVSLKHYEPPIEEIERLISEVVR